MRIAIFLCLFFLSSSSCQNLFGDMMSQLTSSMQNVNSITENNFKLSQVFNPLSWLTPKSVTIPYNPDADLTTVILLKFYTDLILKITKILKLLKIAGNSSKAWLYGRNAYDRN